MQEYVPSCKIAQILTLEMRPIVEDNFSVEQYICTVQQIHLLFSRLIQHWSLLFKNDCK